MKKYYTRTKVFVSIAWLLFSLVFIPLSLYSLLNKELLFALLYVFLEVYATFVCFLLLH